MFAVGVCVGATIQPLVRAVHGGASVVFVATIGTALVKRHDDVCAEVVLRFHYAFRCKNVLATIDMTAESNAFVGDFAQVTKAEHLKTAAVGKDGAIPIHKFVQSACVAHKLTARAKIQVVGVAEDDLRADFFQRAWQQRFDRCTSADRHENGRFDVAVRCMEHACARTRMFVYMLKFKAELLHCISFCKYVVCRYSINIASPKEKKR